MRGHAEARIHRDGLLPGQQALPDLASLYDPRACLSAFIGAKWAHLPVDVAYESDDFSAYSVLFVPSAFSLADDTWARFARFVQGGGALLLRRRRR